MRLRQVAGRNMRGEGGRERRERERERERASFLL